MSFCHLIFFWVNGLSYHVVATTILFLFWPHLGLGQGLNPSLSCNLYHSCGNTSSFNPLCQFRGQTHTFTATRSSCSRIPNPLRHSRNFLARVLSDGKEWLLIIMGVHLGFCNSIDWVVHKQQTFLIVLQAGKFKIKAQAASVSGEDWFLGS